MNKNKILSGGGKNLTGGGKWGWRGREVGGEGEGSGVKGGGKWGERGREVGVGCPPVHPLIIQSFIFVPYGHKPGFPKLLAVWAKGQKVCH